MNIKKNSSIFFFTYFPGLCLVCVLGFIITLWIPLIKTGSHPNAS